MIYRCRMRSRNGLLSEFFLFYVIFYCERYGSLYKLYGFHGKKTSTSSNAIKFLSWNEIYTLKYSEMHVQNLRNLLFFFFWHYIAAWALHVHHSLTLPMYFQNMCVTQYGCYASRPIIPWKTTVSIQLVKNFSGPSKNKCLCSYMIVYTVEYPFVSFFDVCRTPYLRWEMMFPLNKYSVSVSLLFLFSLSSRA